MVLWAPSCCLSTLFLRAPPRCSPGVSQGVFPPLTPRPWRRQRGRGWGQEAGARSRGRGKVWADSRFYFHRREDRKVGPEWGVTVKVQRMGIGMRPEVVATRAHPVGQTSAFIALRGRAGAAEGGRLPTPGAAPGVSRERWN